MQNFFVIFLSVLVTLIGIISEVINIGKFLQALPGSPEWKKRIVYIVAIGIIVSAVIITSFISVLGSKNDGSNISSISTNSLTVTSIAQIQATLTPSPTATSILTPTPTFTPSPIPPTPILPATCTDQNGAPPNGVVSTVLTINCTVPSGRAALIVVCNHAQLLQPFNQDLEGPGMISYQNPAGSSSINIKAENSALANASCPSKFLVLPLTQVDGQVMIEVQRLKTLIGNNAGVTYFNVVGENATRNYY